MDNRHPDGCEYVIPSMARRCIAEMVDDFILLLIKTVILVSVAHLIGTKFGSIPLLELSEAKDVSSFARRYLIEDLEERLEKTIGMAIVYQLLTFFYEIICIRGAGGATPGKFLLGLQVVTCDTSVLVAPSRVRVRPSSRVTMAASFKRALFKKVCLYSVFSLFVTWLFLKENRTAYDIVSGTIVVKRQ
ncbi:protein FAM8A1-like [Sceloporus undulatus]|uniref:protein FAM8A1-like n=1 Tax=Sceloporus undulatus TaxID=8520 RepID=UPI001C4A9AC3|nr:protein FAM8A1-like [Sceloporus undulatus]XP_042334153.1 protein FAM8A1-like [Sceloporus undulatus]XP_042334154.1 protein FAM8A1-like [Sceloporus undulatus]